MSQRALQSVYRILSAEDQAGRRCMENLLNCYCREVAGPSGQIGIGPLFGQSDWPLALRAALHRTGGQVMHVLLSSIGSRLLVVVDAPSPTGNYRYRSQPYYKLPGRPWTLLDWTMLSSLLLREMALRHALPFNAELMEQIRDSVAVTATILAKSQPEAFSAEPLAAYLESEQSLTFGHAFHPAPKSRQGFSPEDLQRYSPELGTSFPLYYFAVRREHLVQESLLSESAEELIRLRAPAESRTDDDFAVVPVHPWQARYLFDHPLVRAALREDRLRDLGIGGPAYFPTSSIRTLFHPENPYFYKLSLNVRITNCVRKNAHYELEGALAVTRIMRQYLPAIRGLFPEFRVLEEPAFLSLDLHGSDRQENRAVTEGFGLILREGLDRLAEGETPLLAGALFGNRSLGRVRLMATVNRLAEREGLSLAAAAESWFDAYVEHLLYPVFHCFFSFGLIFEPHLQNVLAGIRGGRPCRVWLRDFEGVKLVRERRVFQELEGVSERARQALFYSEEQGWNRIAYCLFVNNFCEAIAQLGEMGPSLERRLWTVLRHHLREYQWRYGDLRSAGRINALLAGQPLPAKANFINRFLKRPDRDAGYVPLPHPLAQAGEP